MSKYTEENPFKLSTKQLKFCELYLFHETYRGNGTQSAIQAGYKENSAKVTASKLLTKANLTKHVSFLEQKFADELQKRTAVDAADVLEKIIKKEYGLDYSPVNITQALELYFKVNDRMPRKRVEVTGKDGEAIEVSEVTRMVMVMPNERPVPEYPGEQPAKPVEPEKQPEPIKKENPALSIVLQTLTNKGVKKK
jgi:hypothetical protein